MLLWAVFSLGYLFGVFVTLKIVGEKDEEMEGATALRAKLAPSRASGAWEIFKTLTRVNFQKGELRNRRFTLRLPKFISSLNLDNRR